MSAPSTPTDRLPLRLAIMGGSVVAIGVLLIIMNAVGDRVGTPEWRELRSQILPQFVQASHKDRVPIVHRPLSPNIDIAIVIDHPEQYEFVMAERLKTWEITEDQLYEQAMENLETLAANTKIDIAEATAGKDEKYAIIETTDGYAAVRLLSETVRTKVHEALGPQFVAGIPIRDFMILWDPQFSLGDQFLGQVQQEYDAEEKYQLTPEPFLVTQGQGIQALKREAKPSTK